MQLDHNRLDLGLPSLPPIIRDGFLSIPAGTRLLPSIGSVSLQRKLISFHVSTRLCTVPHYCSYSIDIILQWVCLYPSSFMYRLSMYQFHFNYTQLFLRFGRRQA